MGERADRSSSAGSTPSRRTIQLAAPLVSLIAGVSNAENSSCAATTARAVDIGRATARYLGTSSPNTIDTEVTISNARNAMIASPTRSGMPTASSQGCGRSSTIGSVR